MTPFRGLTLDGLKELISDQRLKGVNVAGIVVHPHDHHDLAEEVMALAKQTNKDTDIKRDRIIIAGVIVAADWRQPKGRAAVMHRMANKECEIAKVI